jgi:hypothetical protein
VVVALTSSLATLSFLGAAHHRHCDTYDSSSPPAFHIERDRMQQREIILLGLRVRSRSACATASSESFVILLTTNHGHPAISPRGHVDIITQHTRWHVVVEKRSVYGFSHCIMPFKICFNSLALPSDSNPIAILPHLRKRLQQSAENTVMLIQRPREVVKRATKERNHPSCPVNRLSL